MSLPWSRFKPSLLKLASGKISVISPLLHIKLKQANIQLVAKILIEKSKLQELYLVKRKSTREIAKKYNCTHKTIENRMKEFKILPRGLSSSRMRYLKKDFSQDLIEKAYLIGFRLGDLNVYKTNPQSELIVARCNTTQKAQISLTKELFSKYGKVTISKGGYSSSVNCFLNTSFKFLLPKHKRIPPWIGKLHSTSLAFIAGYTDAEGNFIINQSKARFKIDSYDKNILLWTVRKLKKSNIKVKLRLIAKKNQIRTDYKRYNQNLWRLNINEANSLLDFIMSIDPYIKHSNRKYNMLTCLQNILERIKNGTVTD